MDLIVTCKMRGEYAYFDVKVEGTQTNTNLDTWYNENKQQLTRLKEKGFVSTVVDFMKSDGYWFYDTNDNNKAFAEFLDNNNLNRSNIKITYKNGTGDKKYDSAPQAWKQYVRS